MLFSWVKFEAHHILGVEEKMYLNEDPCRRFTWVPPGEVEASVSRTFSLMFPHFHLFIGRGLPNEGFLITEINCLFRCRKCAIEKLFTSHHKLHGLQE